MAGATSQRRLRVLVVDDCPDMRGAMQLLLEAWGYECRLAADGPAALETAAAFDPEVVLLDLGLPGMDGFKVAEALRAWAPRAQTIVVAISGFVGETYSRRCREVGMDMHLAKPVEPEALQELLASWERVLHAPGVSHA